MYKLLKPKGYNQNVTLENTDTHASIIIGRLSMVIVTVLEKEGYNIDDPSSSKYLELTKEWDITINEDTKKELQHMAMKMTKPIRKTNKQDVEQVNSNKSKTTSAPVDVFSLIFGLDDDLINKK